VLCVACVVVAVVSVGGVVVSVDELLDGAIVIFVGILWYAVWYIGWAGLFSRIVCGLGVWRL